MTLPVVGTLPTPWLMEAEVPPVLDQERIVRWPLETAGGFALKKAMEGAATAVTPTPLVFDVEPLAFVAVRVTLKTPALEKTCVGFRAVEVCPSPKFQNQEVALPEERS